MKLIHVTAAQALELGLTEAEVNSIFGTARSMGQIGIGMRTIGVEKELKSGAEDSVTNVDKALSAIAVRVLTNGFPDDLIQSEEAPWAGCHALGVRRWWVDPVDGTKYFAVGDPCWGVMIALEQNGSLVCGWLALPDLGIEYCGGPALGAFRHNDLGLISLDKLTALDPDQPVRVLVSKNDLKANAWLKAAPGIEIVTATSIGADLHEIICGRADVFVHIRPTLKYWDTASPGAIALGLGLEVGTEDGAGLEYGFDNPDHQKCVVIGKSGALAWWAGLWAQRAELAAKLA